jgi:hypothetical protein
MNLLTLASDISILHQDAIIEWYQNGINFQYEGLLNFVAENHAFNFQLWNAEDRARREDKGHSFVYEAKREIDNYNQQRNNRMETIDVWFANTLTPASAETCPVHSETPGMIIDRLSILSLKCYHMAEQATRESADATHRETCSQKLTVLQAQHKQLTACLQQLIQDIVAQIRTFRLYHQFKMYNDPALNPELYTPST